MKTNLTILIFLLAATCVFSQTTLKITGGQLRITEDVSIVLKNASWQNGGSFIANAGSIILTGDATSSEASIGGSVATTFHDLEINKSANAAQLDQAIGVDNELTMTAGHLDLNGHDLTLGSTNGQIVDEKESSRIVGSAGGEVVKTVDLDAPASANPGNIGLEITSTEDLGSTVIRRGHVPPDILGLEGIKRYFTITPSNNVGLDASVRFYYFNGELNSLTETELEPWRYDSTNWLNYAKTDSSTSANWAETANINAFSTWALGQGALKINPKVFLQGPYTGVLMSDALRSNNLIPTTEPYTGLGYTQVGGGGEVVSPNVFNVTGDDAIVDWVLLELRDKNNPTNILRTKSTLLQRDGDIVELDGVLAVSFAGIAADDYYLAVRHRNHLGIRTAAAEAMSISATSYDFSTGLTQAWDNPTISSNDAMVDIDSGVYGLWRADINGNGSINVVDFILVKNGSTPNQGSVYLGEDISLDGNVNIVDYIITKSQSTPNKSAHLD